jgi:hypothetical protein
MSNTAADLPIEDTAPAEVVRYRVGLNPLQEQIAQHVRGLTGLQIQGILESLYTSFPSLVPVFPQPSTTEAWLSNEGDGLFHPNDLVNHIGLHADTIEKYLLNFIGIPSNGSDAKKLKMTVAHPDAPWGADYAKYLTDPLPLRLVSARALVFILLAPASIYRPTTNDSEIVGRWSRLVDFRNRAPALFGIPKGSPTRIANTEPTTTAVRRKTKTSNNTENSMPIPTLFTLSSMPSADDVSEAVIKSEPAPAKSEPNPAKPEPTVTAPLATDAYLADLQDLRDRAYKLRELLDLLPQPEIDERVIAFYRASLNALDARHGPLIKVYR